MQDSPIESADNNTTEDAQQQFNAHNYDELPRTQPAKRRRPIPEPD